MKRFVDKNKTTRPEGVISEPEPLAGISESDSQVKDDRTQWWEALESALQSHGIEDPSSTNVLRLRRRFGLEHLIDREGMRLALQRKRAPRDPKLRQEILDAIQQNDIRPEGIDTADTLLYLLRDAAPYYRVEQTRSVPADLRLESKHSKSVILVRCIDDPIEKSSSQTVASRDALKEHINAAAQLITSGAANAVHLITWNAEAVGDLSSDAERRGVRIESVPQFLSTFFNFGQAKEAFQEQLIKKLGPQILADSNEVEWLPLKWQMVGGRSGGDADLSKLLLTPNDNLSEGKTTIIIGKTGAGKSSIVFQNALALVKEWQEQAEYGSGALQKIPVVVRGRDLGSERSFDSLTVAVSQNIALQYDLSLPVSSTRQLLQRGYLSVMIDSLEETSGFDSLEDLQAFISHLQCIDRLGSDFLITCRTEVFPLEEQDQICSLETEGRLRWIVLAHLDPEAVATRTDHLLRLSTAARLNRSLMTPALQPLLSRPLFYRAFSEEASRDHIARLGVPARGKQHAVEQTGTFYELFGALARKWADQVIDGYPVAEYKPKADNFLRLCTLLVGTFFEMAIQRYPSPADPNSAEAHDPNPSLQNQQMYPLEELLEKLEHAGWAPGSKQKPLRRDELLRFLSYSTVFCHQVEGPTCMGELCMPSTSMLVYFLAEYLIEPFFGTAHENLKNTKLLLERLSLTSLERFRIPYLKSELPGPQAEMDPFGGDASSLLLVFMSGSLFVKKMSDRLAAIASDLSGASESRSTEQQDTIQASALSSLRAPLWLSENLIFLQTRGTPQLHNHSTETMELKGFSCPLSDFTRIATTSRTISISGDANLEFASFPTGVQVKRLATEYLRRANPDSVAGLVGDKTSQDSLKAAIHNWNRRANLLGECRLVLGGKYSVGQYDHDETQRRLRQGEYPYPGSRRIQVPTFLIQNRPVSNLDFLHFLRAKRGQNWEPIAVRDDTRNDYYLRTWDEVIDKITWTKLRWDPISELIDLLKQNGFDHWINAPVVYINWSAAKAFATWLNCRLPTEAEYEAAARAQQPADLLADDSKRQQATEATTFLGSDLPWVSNLKPDLSLGGIYPLAAIEGYALRLHQPETASESHMLFPYIRKELPLPAKVSGWEQSVCDKLKENGFDESLARALCPVRHLVGGLRYWMEDVWNPCWPPTNRFNHDDQGVYLESPYQDGWSSTWKDDKGAVADPEKAKGWRDGTQRVLRGSSLQMSDSQMRISYRESQREANVNPDVGFRCVQAVWNNRAIDYPTLH